MGGDSDQAFENGKEKSDDLRVGDCLSEIGSDYLFEEFNNPIG